MVISQDMVKKNNIKCKNDIEFYFFIKDNLIKPLDNGHLGIRVENEYSVIPDIVCLSDEALDVTLDIIKENEVKNNSYKI